MSVSAYKNGEQQPLTHVLMNPDKGLVVDHISGDVLDNRRSNLRVCTVAQNVFNSRKRYTSRVPYKGVEKRRPRARDRNPIKTWRAQIHVSGKKIHLGYYLTPELAHEAYRVAAAKYRGEFARVD